MGSNSILHARRESLRTGRARRGKDSGGFKFSLFLPRREWNTTGSEKSKKEGGRESE